MPVEQLDQLRDVNGVPFINVFLRRGFNLRTHDWSTDCAQTGLGQRHREEEPAVEIGKCESSLPRNVSKNRPLEQSEDSSVAEQVPGH